jgi:hypothetical protein
MRIIFYLILNSWVSIFFLTACDKDDQPQVYFDSNGCESSVPIADYAHVSLSWDGRIQRVDTVLYGVHVNPSLVESYGLTGLTLSASCNFNQVWTSIFNNLSVNLDTLGICSEGCNPRFLDVEETTFSFGIWNFDEPLAYYTPIEHSSNFFYIKQEDGEGSDMLFSYKVHLKQNGSFASRDIYPDTLIMETTDAVAFYSEL